MALLPILGGLCGSKRGFVVGPQSGGQYCLVDDIRDMSFQRCPDSVSKENHLGHGANRFPLKNNVLFFSN